MEQPFTSASLQPPLVSGVGYACCQLAVLLNEIVNYNTNNQKDCGNPADVRSRLDFYGKLEAFRSSLPLALRHDENFTPQTCFLR